MVRSLMRAVLALVAFCGLAMQILPAEAMPIDTAPAAIARHDTGAVATEQVRYRRFGYGWHRHNWHRGYGWHRPYGFGWHRPYWHRGYGYGWHRPYFHRGYGGWHRPYGFGWHRHGWRGGWHGGWHRHGGWRHRRW